MRRLRLLPVFGGLVLGLAGCGSDPPAPKPLSAEEEKQFEQQREKDRQNERRAEKDG